MHAYISITHTSSLPPLVPRSALPRLFHENSHNALESAREDSMMHKAGSHDYWSAWDDLLIAETSSNTDENAGDCCSFPRLGRFNSMSTTVDLEDDRWSLRNSIASCDGSAWT